MNIEPKTVIEFTFDGTNKSLPAELRVMKKNEYFRVAGVPISNTLGRIIELESENDMLC